MVKPDNIIFSAFNQFIKILYVLARNVVIASLALMVVLVVIDITGRNLASTSLPGTVEISEYLLIIAGFIGIFLTYHEKGHVSVELLFDRLPVKLKRILNRFNSAVIFVFSVFLMIAGAERFWSAYQSGETNWFGAYVMPVWWVRIVIPICCFALCLQSLIYFWKPELESGQLESNRD